MNNKRCEGITDHGMQCKRIISPKNLAKKCYLHINSKNKPKRYKDIISYNLPLDIVIEIMKKDLSLTCKGRLLSKSCKDRLKNHWLYLIHNIPASIFEIFGYLAKDMADILVSKILMIFDYTNEYTIELFVLNGKKLIIYFNYYDKNRSYKHSSKCTIPSSRDIKIRNNFIREYQMGLICLQEPYFKSLIVPERSKY